MFIWTYSIYTNKYNNIMTKKKVKFYFTLNAIHLHIIYKNIKIN